MPESLVLNNELQLDSKSFCKYCSDLGVKNRYSTSAYPRAIAKLRLQTKQLLLD